MDELYKEGLDFFLWNYESQTKMKHKILQDYLDIWITKLGKWNEVNVFDCFGGCGAYLDDDDNVHWGSPILAAEVIQEKKQNLDRRVNLFVIEKDKKNIDNLKKVFKYREVTINPIIIQGDFDYTINKYLDSTNGHMNPTFFFIDPFGFSIKYSTLKRLMSIPKCEIILNLMFTRINEFLSAGTIKETLNDLFGCTTWQSFIDLHGPEREESIIGLFKKQTKKISKYVFPYRMSFPTQNRTYYYLCHFTNFYQGCTIMKSSFAKFNFGKVEYMGLRHGELTVFDLKPLKLEEVKSYLIEKYLGQKISFVNIIKDIIDETTYLESEIRNALKELREEGVVRTIPIDSKKNGIAGNDIVIFQ